MFFLLVRVEENFSRTISMFSSANFNIKVHSAEEKLGFLARLLTLPSLFVFPAFKEEKTGLVRLEVNLIADS